MARKSKNLGQSRSAATGSWMALVAATTLGDGAATLLAEVRADGVSEGAYRLVVQSYETQLGAVPGAHARPVGCVQRAVTADDLRRGVRVNLLELREAFTREGTHSPTVLAWIETGKPDLEFDGRTARPSAGSVYGIVKRRPPQGVVQIHLDRRMVA